MKTILLEDGRVVPDQVEQCKTESDIMKLWETDVVSKNFAEPQLSFDDFKQLIILTRHEEEVMLSEEEAERVAVFAFELLDTDNSKTLTFDEFEVVFKYDCSLSHLFVCLGRVGGV